MGMRLMHQERTTGKREMRGITAWKTACYLHGRWRYACKMYRGYDLDTLTTRTRDQGSRSDPIYTIGNGKNLSLELTRYQYCECRRSPEYEHGVPRGGW